MTNNTPLGKYQKKADEFFKKSNLLDQDLVYITANFLEGMVSKRAREIFENDPSIISIKGLKPDAQRIIINRYFSNLLFRYRAETKVKITTVITMISGDGEIEDWVKINELYLYPFLRKHGIFEKLFPRKTDETKDIEDGKN